MKLTCKLCGQQGRSVNGKPPEGWGPALDDTDMWWCVHCYKAFSKWHRWRRHIGHQRKERSQQ